MTTINDDYDDHSFLRLQWVKMERKRALIGIFSFIPSKKKGLEAGCIFGKSERINHEFVNCSVIFSSTITKSKFSLITTTSHYSRLPFVDVVDRSAEDWKVYSSMSL